MKTADVIATKLEITSDYNIGQGHCSLHNIFASKMKVLY